MTAHVQAVVAEYQRRNEMSDEPEEPMRPVLVALDTWLDACEPYIVPLETKNTDEVRLCLVRATRELNSALIDLIPYSSTVIPGDDGWKAYNELWKLGYDVRAHLRDLSMQFLMDEYSDSNTDEPNDVAWDVTGLLEMRDPTYHRDPDATPSYVGNILPGPPDDAD